MVGWPGGWPVTSGELAVLNLHLWVLLPGWTQCTASQQPLHPVDLAE